MRQSQEHRTEPLRRPFGPSLPQLFARYQDRRRGGAPGGRFRRTGRQSPARAPRAPRVQPGSCGWRSRPAVRPSGLRRRAALLPRDPPDGHRIGPGHIPQRLRRPLRASRARPPARKAALRAAGAPGGCRRPRLDRAGTRRQRCNGRGSLTSSPLRYVVAVPLGRAARQASPDRLPLMRAGEARRARRGP